jgi:hypothetical protein
MNTPRADILARIDTIADLSNQAYCELYINNDGTVASTFNIKSGLETIARLREECQAFLDISGPEQLQSIRDNPNL